MKGCLLLACAGLSLTGAANATLAPFVGCRSDGQQGPQAAPISGRAPDIPAHAAAKLAYYATVDGVGVLAPRGWYCFGSLGSNGMAVTVAPRPLSWQALRDGTAQRGPIVMLAQTSGGTSGRFQIAEVAARIFPAARAYVARIEAEGVFDKPLARTPFPVDRLAYRGRYQLLFTTPAGGTGLASLIGLKVGILPTNGVEWLHPESDMDLTSLAVRLPPDKRPLVAEIVRQVAPPPKR